jgi:hypothetical protein
VRGVVVPGFRAGMKRGAGGGSGALLTPVKAWASPGKHPPMKRGAGGGSRTLLKQSTDGLAWANARPPAVKPAMRLIPFPRRRSLLPFPQLRSDRTPSPPSSRPRSQPLRHHSSQILTPKP